MANLTVGFRERYILTHPDLLKDRADLRHDAEVLRLALEAAGIDVDRLTRSVKEGDTKPIAPCVNECVVWATGRQASASDRWCTLCTGCVTCQDSCGACHIVVGL